MSGLHHFKIPDFPLSVKPAFHYKLMEKCFNLEAPNVVKRICLSYSGCRGIGMETFDRITRDPGIMGGKPCIRGMRVTVGRILSQIGAGETIDELLADYPWLEREDVLQALQYAAWLSEGYDVALAGA
jgi:uncharacterized protein (DUF433 family)